MKQIALLFATIVLLSGKSALAETCEHWTDAEYFFNKGDKHVERKEYLAAYDAYKKLINCVRGKKLWIKTYASLAVVSLKLNDRGKAEEYIRDLFKISPMNKWGFKFCKKHNLKCKYERKDIATTGINFVRLFSPFFENRNVNWGQLQKMKVDWNIKRKAPKFYKKKGLLYVITGASILYHKGKKHGVSVEAYGDKKHVKVFGINSAGDHSKLTELPDYFKRTKYRLSPYKCERSKQPASSGALLYTLFRKNKPLGWIREEWNFGSGGGSKSINFYYDEYIADQDTDCLDM